MQDLARLLGRGDLEPEPFEDGADARDLLGVGLDAAVARLEFLGSEVLVFVRAVGSGDEAVAKMSPTEAAGLRAGRPVALAPEPGAALAFTADGARLPPPSPIRVAAGGSR
jgi:multiple sugar transport system ATP-binding protein